MNVLELSEQEIVRRNNLNELRALGIDPYPADEYPTDAFSTDIKAEYNDAAEEKRQVCIAGRIMSRRIMGKASFLELQDSKGRIQVYVTRDDICPGENKDLYNTVFKKLLDLGDFVGIKGFVFKTQTGEISVHTQELTVLAKSLRPLPIVKMKDGEVYDSFDDPELRYRQRYVVEMIIATAGHVDHGKTALIKALTGIETDRIKEEKKRGITIELGFAYLDLPDGEKAGIIDVPGHEKFVKNMLAGAGGIDLALLVVAADEGFMPQTREHLGILSLLNISEGIIVVTKKDMVDEDWLEIVCDEVRQEVQGTFLENAQIIPVSSYTGEGIEQLRQAIFTMIDQKTQIKNLDVPFRIPVDRIFSVEGFGTVITGTLIEGTMKVGDPVTVYPSRIESRIRNLQVHSQDVQEAYAGQRVAVNLAGLKKTDLNKGDVIAVPDSMHTTMMIDIHLTVLKDCDREIRNATRLHLYHGARDILCKIVLLDRDSVGAGESCYVW